MNRHSRSLAVSLSLLAMMLPTRPLSARSRAEAWDPAGLQRLAGGTRGTALVTLHPATGAARFVRFAPEVPPLAALAAGTSGDQGARAFFLAHGSVFGVKDPASELRLTASRTDALGQRHVSYAQRYRGVPVFGAVLRVHFDARGRIQAVNGAFIPDVDLDINASRTAVEAAALALKLIAAEKPSPRIPVARQTRLVVYREGLAKGEPGPNPLAYEVEVSNGGDVHEFVYVDAHSGKLVDRISGVYDTLNRRAFDGKYELVQVPSSYPGTPFWLEGDPLPTSG